MNTHLPADLEEFVQAKVRSGRFSSSDEAITAAVRLLREQEEAEAARVLEDMRAGRTQPLAEALAGSRPTRMTEAKFKQQLLKSGLMSSLPTPSDPASRPAFQPIAIEGEPLSETILRERR